MVINSQDSLGATPLNLASQRGHVRIIQLLLEKEADPDIVNHHGETALVSAARSGDMPVVELLLVSGADPMIEDDEGWTPFHWAVIGGHNGMAKILLGHYERFNSSKTEYNKSFILAAEAGNVKMTQMLLDGGADVDWKDEEGHDATLGCCRRTRRGRGYAFEQWRGHQLQRQL